MTFVSAIIPTRDRAGMIGAAVRSVLAQDVACEVIVVDDGSRDDTSDVLRGFGRDVVVVHGRGDGVAVARNLGVAHARGEHVAFLDSDDVWLPGKLARQTEVMGDAALSFTDYTMSEWREAWVPFATRRHEGELTLARLIERNFIGTSTVVARRSVLLAQGGFEPTLVRGSDYDLWLRLRRCHPVVRVPYVGTDYRWHAASLTGASKQRNRQNHIDVIERLARVAPDLFVDADMDVDAVLANARARLEAP